MRIGLDLDGVVIDSERAFRTYEEIYAIEDLKDAKIVNYKEPKYQDRYAWSLTEQSTFNQKYLLKAASESSLMPGFLPIYERLKKLGHELIIISARGGFIAEMKDNALELLKKHNLTFTNYYWHISNKLEICQKEKIDLMIDDDYKVIRQISKGKIKTLYFRDTNLKKLEENDYVHEVNNWGDIYRYIVKLDRGEK